MSEAKEVQDTMRQALMCASMQEALAALMPKWIGHGI